MNLLSNSWWNSNKNNTRRIPERDICEIPGRISDRKYGKISERIRIGMTGAFPGVISGNISDEMVAIPDGISVGIPQVIFGGNTSGSMRKNAGRTHGLIPIRNPGRTFG